MIVFRGRFSFFALVEFVFLFVFSCFLSFFGFRGEQGESLNVKQHNTHNADYISSP